MSVKILFPSFVPCVALLALGLSSIQASAQTISVNFNNGQFTLLESTDVAGVVPDDNWNNFANNGGLGLETVSYTHLTLPTTPYV